MSWACLSADIASAVIVSVIVLWGESGGLVCGFPLRPPLAGCFLTFANHLLSSHVEPRFTLYYLEGPSVITRILHHLSCN